MSATNVRVAALVGPTAVGKTEVSVAVAERLGAEIISIDSMQIYKSMDIGTAKPSREQRERVSHHLVDVRMVSHDLTVAEFQSLARRAISDVVNRGKLPMLVGGSGLYWRAVVDDLEFPPRSPSVRAALETEAERIGGPRIHERLRVVDPVAAAAIAPANIRRTVRALEVIEITGRPFSEFARAWTRYESRYRLRVAGLRRARQELFQRIESRVDHMIATGLLDEARSIGASQMSRAARQALGYRQVLEAEGDVPVGQIRDAIVRATKRFARRQESWFNADPRIVWFDGASPDLVDQLVWFFEEIFSDEGGRIRALQRTKSPQSDLR
jgi:tRNA dimethylallyltransferase